MTGIGSDIWKWMMGVHTNIPKENIPRTNIE